MAGLARAGLAAARRLIAVAGPHEVSAWDGDALPHAHEAAEELRRAGVDVRLGGEGVDLLQPDVAGACVIKSPGMPGDVPLLAEAGRRGHRVIDELELGWRLDRRPLVGVTGTNGKSTVASLVVALLRERGMRPALAGNTQFGPPLSALPEAEGDTVVCEVSSFQLEACPELLPEIAVFTNLADEHLDRHGTMAAYGEAKRRLFVRGDRCVPLAVVNVDHEHGRRIADDVESRGGTVARFGTGEGSDHRLVDCSWDLQTGVVEVESPGGRSELATRLPGRHNALNVVAAVAFAEATGMSPERAHEVVSRTPGVPGRFEPIEAGQDFDVVVDYAHNPDGIRFALRTARAVAARRDARVLAVCSAMSIVTEAQRHAMGVAAAESADELILTTDRWRADSDAALPAGLATGAGSAAAAKCSTVLDRAEAIETALRRAHASDIVMILGRGSRSGSLVGPDGSTRPFDDREHARAVLRRLPHP